MEISNPNSLNGHVKGRTLKKSSFSDRKLKENTPKLEMEKDTLISQRTLVDNVDDVRSVGQDHSLISEYESELEELEKDLDWMEEENRPISELVLNRKGSR